MSQALEWFAKPNKEGEVGLRFSCTQCGNCCTGAEGFVLFTADEASSMADHLGLTTEQFFDQYTCETSMGRSLKETRTDFGLDCVFLDRSSVPGKVICSVYEHRPEQCRTWPFWPSNLGNARMWEQAGVNCPGLGHGHCYSPEHIRLTRDRVHI